MNWWNDLSDWAASDHGWRIISGAIIPFVAIVVAGVIAAFIGRGATKRVVGLQDRESRNAAVAGIVSAARKAASWGTLTHDERSYADHLAEDADIRLRLLPVPGAPVAANWAQHEIADIKKNSSTFSFQAEQSLSEFRDRMLEWQARPSRARKLFRADLERWKFEAPDANADLIDRQQQWSADQASAGRPAATANAGDTARGSGSAGLVAGSGIAASTSTSTPTARFPLARPQSAGDQGAPDAARSASSTASAAPAGTTTPALPTVPPRSDGSSTEDAPAAPTLPPVASSDPERRSGSERTGDSELVPAPPRPGADHVNADRNGTGPDGTGPDDIDRVDANHTDADADAVDSDGRDDEPVAGELTHPKIDAASAPGANTTSVPTRIADAPVEPADPNETNEAPYATPLSASELRRRAQDDEDDE